LEQLEAKARNEQKTLEMHDTADKLDTRLKRLLKVSNIHWKSKRFGPSPSLVDGMIEPRQTKKPVRARTHGKRVHEVKANKGVLRNTKTIVLARVCVIRARPSHKKLKLMFSPFGRSLPCLKINFISCCLRLMLLPEHCSSRRS